MKRKGFSADPSALIPLILIWSNSEKKEVLLFLGAVALHEAGHVLALLRFGCRVRGVSLSFAGAGIETEDPYLSYKKEARIFLAGPLAGLFGCLLAWFCLRLNFTKGGMLFFSFNLLLSLFNLLPVKGLDGGEALFALLCRYGEERTAQRISELLHGLSLCFLLAVSLWVFSREKNASLFLLTLALAAGGRKRKKATITS